MAKKHGDIGVDQVLNIMFDITEDFEVNMKELSEIEDKLINAIENNIIPSKIEYPQVDEAIEELADSDDPSEIAVFEDGEYITLSYVINYITNYVSYYSPQTGPTYYSAGSPAEYDFELYYEIDGVNLGAIKKVLDSSVFKGKYKNLKCSADEVNYDQFDNDDVYDYDW